MRNIRIRLKHVLCVGLLLLGGVVDSVQAQVVVIAHASVPVDSLGQVELYQLFSGNQEYWDNGLPVVIIDLASKGDIRDSFYNFLGKTSSRMRSIWLKRKLSGEGELPRSIEVEELLVETVSETEGAIGFASAASIVSNEKIKVLINAIPVVID